MSASTESLRADKLFDLSGWVTLVTGGGTGIGLMCAQTLAANKAKVYIASRDMESLENAAKQWSTDSKSSNGAGQLIPAYVDISRKDSIEKLYKEISEKEEQLHLLVNNAGIDGPTRGVERGAESAEALSSELMKDTFEDWQQVYAINVIGHHFMSAAFLPLLGKATEKNYGFSSSIVNISSISGQLKISQHHMPYNASKAAAIQLTEMFAVHCAEAGTKVRVNSIAPGVFPSGMTTDGVDSDQKSRIDASGYREKKGIPAGRPGKEEDMAIALLGCATNQYMNGETVRVDGGYLLRNP